MSHRTRTQRELLDSWAAKERPQPEGWDFSPLERRMSQSTEPWDLPAVWRTALTSAPPGCSTWVPVVASS